MQLFSFVDFEKRVWNIGRTIFVLLLESSWDKKFSDKDNQNLVDNLIAETFSYD